MSKQIVVSTIAQAVIALAAVIGLVSAGIGYVAAQTHEVENYNQNLQRLSAQIPLVWDSVREQGSALEELQAAVLHNRELLETRDRENEERYVNLLALIGQLVESQNDEDNEDNEDSQAEPASTVP